MSVYLDSALGGEEDETKEKVGSELDCLVSGEQTLLL